MPSQVLLRRAATTAAATAKRRLLLSQTANTASVMPNVFRYFSTQHEVEEHHENESFLTGSSSLYAEQMWEQYTQDPNSVHESWKKYFDDLQSGVPYAEEAFDKPTAVPPSKVSARATVSADSVPSDSLGVSHLIRAYQVNGHFAANLDPLGLHSPLAFPGRPSNSRDTSQLPDGWPEELTPEYHGFTHPEDMDRKLNFKGRSSGGNKGYLEELASAPGKVTLRGIVDQLRQSYCGTLGVEYMHMGDNTKINWMRERIENPRWQNYDKETKQHIYERLCFADTFENFLAYKFNTTKRFGLDGGEAIVPVRLSSYFCCVYHILTATLFHCINSTHLCALLFHSISRSSVVYSL